MSALRDMFTPDETPTKPASRKVTRTRILTAPEFIAEMRAKEETKKKLAAEKEERKRQREEKRELKKRENELKKQNKNKTQTRARKAGNKKQKEDFSFTSSENEDDPDPISSSETDEEEDFCSVCKKKFSADSNGQVWIQCRICQEWSHLKCQKLKDYKADFTCKKCEKTVPGPSSQAATVPMPEASAVSGRTLRSRKV